MSTSKELYMVSNQVAHVDAGMHASEKSRKSLHLILPSTICLVSYVKARLSLVLRVFLLQTRILLDVLEKEKKFCFDSKICKLVFQ